MPDSGGLLLGAQASAEREEALCIRMENQSPFFIGGMCGDVKDIISPPPSEGWIGYPVNRRVNSPKNDDAKLIEPEPA